jgi:VIT1/CCC1 family predicted Fe2+/Mn2+ transporter
MKCRDANGQRALAIDGKMLRLHEALFFEDTQVMATRRPFHRRQPLSPPKEGFLSSVLGEFLDPIDAVFAIFFSILFALLFTLSYGILMYRGILDSSFASGYGQNLFVAILGAVTIWGMIDGVIYGLSELFARQERYRLLQYVQSNGGEETAVAAIADTLDFILEPITSDDQRDALYQDILGTLREAEPQAVGLQRADVIGAAAVVLLSVAAVMPSLLPLLLLPENTALAIRASNAISILVIFATGYSWGVHTDNNPWKSGLLLASVCLLMVLAAILLGGY